MIVLDAFNVSVSAFACILCSHRLQLHCLTDVHHNAAFLRIPPTGAFMDPSFPLHFKVSPQKLI